MAEVYHSEMANDKHGGNDTYLLKEDSRLGRSFRTSGSVAWLRPNGMSHTTALTLCGGSGRATHTHHTVVSLGQTLTFRPDSLGLKSYETIMS